MTGKAGVSPAHSNPEPTHRTGPSRPAASIVRERRRSLEQVRQAVPALNRLRDRIVGRTQERAKLADGEVHSAIGEGRR